jgi:hypothetical protein
MTARTLFILVKRAVVEGVKKCSLFNVQLSFVIFGGAFGAASFKKTVREAPPFS